MNPLTNMKNVIKLSEQELNSSGKSSWHDQYRDSAWIFVGGLPFDLTEGDIICIFSQYGEIVNINLIRTKDTGKSKGFCFICYEDQRSTVLSVDNLNGIKILGRTLRVDHVSEYKIPKENKKTDEETKKLYQEGCAPKVQPIIPKVKTPPRDFRETIADQIQADIKLPPRLPIHPIKQEETEEKVKLKKEKKNKKDKKKKSKKKKSKKHQSSDSDDSGSSDSEPQEKKKRQVEIEVKREVNKNDYSEPKQKEFEDRSRSFERKNYSSKLHEKSKDRKRSRSSSYERKPHHSKSSNRMSPSSRKHKR